MASARLWLWSLVLLPLSLFGQKKLFEGDVKYGIRYEVTASDRPDLEMYASMVPTNMLLSVKGINSLLRFEGGETGGLLGDILYLSKPKRIYTLLHKKKSALYTPVSKLDQTQHNTLNALATGEREKLLGFTCTVYEVKNPEDGSKTRVWCTTAFSNAKSDILTYFLGSLASYRVTGLVGLPLKISFSGSEFGLTFLAEELKQRNLPSHLFAVPKGYTLAENGLDTEGQ